MNEFSDIICYRHCGKNIFLHRVPECCPMCGVSSNNIVDMLPFTLSSPFINATQYPCAIILRPSNGDFLRDFEKESGLHIALTNSKRTIVEYDKDGLLTTPVRDVKSNLWSQCILIKQIPETWYDAWDEALQIETSVGKWNREHYHEDRNNCYSFVLAFLNRLRYVELSANSTDKVSFCEKFIKPQTSHAAKYITVHRKLQTMSYFIDTN